MTSSRVKDTAIFNVFIVARVTAWRRHALSSGPQCTSANGDHGPAKPLPPARREAPRPSVERRRVYGSRRNWIISRAGPV